MLKRRLQSAGGRVGDLFAGGYVIAAAEEMEGACFVADFSSVHSQNDLRICLNSLVRKKSSLQHVIKHDSALIVVVVSVVDGDADFELDIIILANVANKVGWFSTIFI
jgi:hypothetical protein